MCGTSQRTWLEILTHLLQVNLSSCLSHHLLQPEILPGLWAYRNFNCVFLWFHNTHGHGGFYPLNISAFWQITASILQIISRRYTTAKSPLASKFMVNKMNIHIYMYQGIPNFHQQSIKQYQPIAWHQSVIAEINNIATINSIATTK